MEVLQPADEGSVEKKEASTRFQGSFPRWDFKIFFEEEIRETWEEIENREERWGGKERLKFKKRQEGRPEAGDHSVHVLIIGPYRSW